MLFKDGKELQNLLNSFSHIYTMNTHYKEEKKITSDEILLHQDPTIKIQIKRYFAEKLEVLDAIFKTTIGPALAHIPGDAEQTSVPCINGNQMEVIINIQLRNWLCNCSNKNKWWVNGVRWDNVYRLTTIPTPPTTLNKV